MNLRRWLALACTAACVAAFLPSPARSAEEAAKAEKKKEGDEKPAAEKPPKTIESIVADLARDETSLKMVAVEALVIEVNEERTRDLGLNYGFNTIERDNGVLTQGSGIISGADVRLGRALSPVRVPLLIGAPGGRNALGFASRAPGFGISLTGIDVGSGAISARLRALLDSGDAMIRTRPVAIGLNRTPVRIESRTDVPYLDMKVDNKLDIVIEKVGVLMEVVPIIEHRVPPQITLEINRLEVSGVSSFITRSDTSTKVTLNEGETFVVGGLKTRRFMKQQDRIPILGSIPYLGVLFQSQEQIERNVDVLFFITPYIQDRGENFQPTFEFRNKEALGIKVRQVGR